MVEYGMPVSGMDAYDENTIHVHGTTLRQISMNCVDQMKSLRLFSYWLYGFTLFDSN